MFCFYIFVVHFGTHLVEVRLVVLLARVVFEARPPLLTCVGWGAGDTPSAVTFTVAVGCHYRSLAGDREGETCSIIFSQPRAPR